MVCGRWRVGHAEREKPLVSDGALCRGRGRTGRLRGVDEHAYFLRAGVGVYVNIGLVRRREVNAHRKFLFFISVHVRAPWGQA